ncbi:MAG: VOC family protein [Solirubrobacteraceae bacterium]
MPTRLDHFAVAARDKRRSASFLTDLLGLAEPKGSGPFLSVTLDDGVRLDYVEPGVEGVPFWGGPGHSPGEINTNHGGRGVYFDDPSGHHFELITRPYGADV